MLPNLSLANSSSAGSGDVSTPFNQTFGGIGSPLRAGFTLQELLIPALLVVLIAVVLRKR